MTREQAKELLPIIQAFVDGKTIEARTNSISRWIETTTPKFDLLHEYRIKPEPKYRPFKNAEECWQEMQKHKPFGWVKTDDWYCAIKEIRPTCAFCHGCGDVFHYTDMVKQINFADGTPFGVKVG